MTRPWELLSLQSVQVYVVKSSQKLSKVVTKESYFIKWTTSGEPPVGSGSLSDFYFWRNKQLFSDL